MVYVALVVGILAGGGSLWLRRGSPASRWWERSIGIVDERFAFATFPGLALLLTGVGILALAGLAGQGVLLWVVATIGAVLTLGGLVLTFMGLRRSRLPGWLLPEWRRDRDR
ncbi:MAG: hypothetical protein L0K65_03545 [Actinomyces sp.]|nr:hypothetical protein [Actinomyces sp.]